jgi:signal transduction histidine kinase
VVWAGAPSVLTTVVGRAELAGTLVYFLVSAVVVALAELNRRATALLAVSNQNLRQASETLRRSHEELEWRVKERTRELQQKNSELVTQADLVRDLSGRLLQMQDEERRRIARALHDSLGQIATALSMNLSVVNDEVQQLSSKGTAAITDSLALLQELSREIRAISHLLHPPRQESLHRIGRTEDIRSRFYAISVERKLKHPAVIAICARQQLFSREAVPAQLDQRSQLPRPAPTRRAVT